MDSSPTDKPQSEYWDRVAWDKNCTLPLPLATLRPLINKNTRILDYGCGYGRLAEQLWREGYHRLVGVDVSVEMVHRGRQMHPHLDLRHQPQLPLPQADSSFDLVLLIGVLTSIPGDTAQQAVIGEMNRVLAPGGIACIVDFPLQSDARNRHRYEAARGKHHPYGVFKLEDGAVLRHHSKEWIESLTAPFEPLHNSSFRATTMNGHPADAFHSLCRKPIAP